MATLADDLRTELATKFELHETEERPAADIRRIYDQVNCDDAEHVHELNLATEKRLQAIEKRRERIEKRAH